MVSEKQKAGFDAVGNSPVAWAFVGENLLVALQRLEDDFAEGLGGGAPDELSILSGRLQGPVLMLRAAALECLLKGILVDEGKTLASDGKYVSPGGGQHDLPHFASLTSLLFTQEELWLLKYLSLWISQGRFPVPTRAAARDIRQLDGSPLQSNWSHDYEAQYRTLRQRLATEIHRRTGYGRVE